MGGGQNYETYWVDGINIFPATRENSTQDLRSNDFRSALIIVKNCTEGLPDEKNISLEKPNRNITLKTWIAWIWSYMEYNGMEATFHVYDTDLKY